MTQITLIANRLEDRSLVYTSIHEDSLDSGSIVAFSRVTDGATIQQFRHVQWPKPPAEYEPQPTRNDICCRIGVGYRRLALPINRRQLSPANHAEGTNGRKFLTVSSRLATRRRSPDPAPLSVVR